HQSIVPVADHRGQGLRVATLARQRPDLAAAPFDHLAAVIEAIRAQVAPAPVDRDQAGSSTRLSGMPSVRSRRNAYRPPEEGARASAPASRPSGEVIT